MTDEAVRAAVATAMGEMNRAWLEGNADDMERLVHPDVVMILPGLCRTKSPGREAFINGFRDFSESATVLQFREDDTLGCHRRHRRRELRLRDERTSAPAVDCAPRVETCGCSRTAIHRGSRCGGPALNADETAL